MFRMLKRFIREEGRDFTEYSMILGAIGAIAITVITRYRNELMPNLKQVSKHCAWEEMVKCPTRRDR